MTFNCRHLKGLKSNLDLDYSFVKAWQCSSCHDNSSKFLCLVCGFPTCKHNHDKSGLQNHQKTLDHHIYIDLSNHDVYCFLCHQIVLNDSSSSHIKLIKLSLLKVLEEQNSSRSLRPRNRKRSLPILHSQQVASKKLSTSGLKNLGNTCYLNSVVQLLSHTQSLYFQLKTIILQSNYSEIDKIETKYLLDYIEDSKFLSDYFFNENVYKTRRSAPAGLNGGDDPQSRSTRNRIKPVPSKIISGREERWELTMENSPLFVQLYVLLKMMRIGSPSVISPCNILKYIWNNNADFRGTYQQDAQELFSTLVSQIKTEVNSVLQNVSFDLTFQGQLKNVIKCYKCGIKSSQTDIFNELSLPMPKADEKQPVKLSQMIERFLQESKLENPRIECCSIGLSENSHKVCTNALDQITQLVSLPNILMIQLKRFSWKSGKREKINSHVEFNEILNIPCVGGKKYLPYRLVGVIIHHGKGLNSGHYTAYCRRDSEWYHFNDAKVSKASFQDEVKPSLAYMLLYEKLDI